MPHPIDTNNFDALSAGVSSVTSINTALGQLSYAITQLPSGTIAVTKTIAAGVVVAGVDRNLVAAAETGVADDLIEITGPGIGQAVMLRADTGDTITVKHNDAGATNKIILASAADVVLDEQNPLLLLQVATNILAEQQVSGGGGASLPVADTTSLVEDPVDGTKEMRIDVGNVASATVRTLTMPDADVVLHKDNLAAAVAPTTTDDSAAGYSSGSRWLNTTADKEYVCLDATATAAIWKETTAAGGSSVGAAFTVGYSAVGALKTIAGWRTVECTEVSDPDSAITVASNVITFTNAGTYALVDFFANVRATAATWVQFRVRNTTTNSTLTGSVQIIISAVLRGTFGLGGGGFTVAAGDTVEIQVWPDTQTVKLDTLGTMTNPSGETDYNMKAVFVRTS